MALVAAVWYPDTCIEAPVGESVQHLQGESPGQTQHPLDEASKEPLVDCALEHADPAEEEPETPVGDE